MELEKVNKARKVLAPSKSFSGTAGRGMVVTGAGLGAFHVAAFLLPFISAGLLASIFLPVVLIVGGILLWE